MSAKRVLFLVLVASAVVLAAGAGPGTAGIVRALPPAQESGQVGGTIPYSGHLTDEADQAVANGAYDFAFALYDAETGGSPVWTETQNDVPVRDGAFTVLLGSVNPIAQEKLGGGHWMSVAVRGPGESEFTVLTPRQGLSAVTSLEAASPATGAACPHNHFGEYWLGATSGWTLDGLAVQNTATDRTGIYGSAQSGAASIGVRGTSTQGTGVSGFSQQGNGVYAEGQGGGNTHAALWANNTGNGLAAYLTNNSGFPTLEIDKTGAGGAAIDLQLFNPGNADPAMFIKAYDQNTVLQFLVSTTGIVAANGYVDWKADIAEMLPAAKGLEPGDVLAIGPDGNLIRSTEPYQTSVAGVYSTDPGFMFGHPLEGKTPGTIPLAMTGVVPVKVSAENGSIRPGDLLVASATPGYAMQAGSNPPQGTVIGKALEEWGASTGVIKMLATLQ